MPPGAPQDRTRRLAGTDQAPAEPELHTAGKPASRTAGTPAAAHDALDAAMVGQWRADPEHPCEVNLTTLTDALRKAGIRLTSGRGEGARPLGEAEAGRHDPVAEAQDAAEALEGTKSVADATPLPPVTAGMRVRPRPGSTDPRLAKLTGEVIGLSKVVRVGDRTTWYASVKWEDGGGFCSTGIDAQSLEPAELPESAFERALREAAAGAEADVERTREARVPLHVGREDAALGKPPVDGAFDALWAVVKEWDIKRPGDGGYQGGNGGHVRELLRALARVSVDRDLAAELAALRVTVDTLAASANGALRELLDRTATDGRAV